MQDFDKLGVFYLGKQFDLDAGKTRDDLLLYESKDLTTHAVCVGMTGSGKTGLCLGLLEEAALDGIPAIAIDPKGDLGNLLLAFPELKPGDFQPWVDPADATRKGLTIDQLAERTATQWKDGLASWGEDGARIARYKDAVDLAIYTPGSSAGLPLTVLRSFAAPSESVRQNAEALRERVAASVSGLLALLGIDADPLRSREHILLANLLDQAWRNGRDLDMTTLVREIQQPPFEKVGVMDLESFFSAKDRFALATSLNNLLASPGFSAWMEGEPLDIQRLLYTTTGKPRLSIISIAHLTDAERMFFLTILLGEIIAWMRSQSGTSSLRAILYMDEVFGYFPPSANPPTKTPMLTLLKQARAYGLGVVLATQNPVDLDYKGLSNAGTWFLGRLQTERDKARVLDGLEGASAAAGAKFDRQRMEKILSGLGSRVFLMNNVHEDTPQVFQTRWTLSYLRGPLTREQISTLMASRKSATTTPGTTAKSADSDGKRPVLPPGVPEAFVARSKLLPQGASLVYQPALLGLAKVHFVDARDGIEHWQDYSYRVEIGDEISNAPWEASQVTLGSAFELEPEPDASAVRFVSLPAELMRAKTFNQLTGDLKDFVYQATRLRLWKCETLGELSRPAESKSDFQARLASVAKTQADAEFEKMAKRFDKEITKLKDQQQRALQRLEREKTQRWKKIRNAIWRFLCILPEILLRVLTNSGRGSRKIIGARDMGRVGTTGRAIGDVMSEGTDVGQAADNLETIQTKIKQQEEARVAEETKIKQQFDTSAMPFTEATVTPRKADTNISRVTILWLPYFVDTTGKSAAAFEMPA